MLIWDESHNLQKNVFPQNMSIFFSFRPPPELLPVLGLLERYMTPTLDAVYIHICHINTVRQAGFDPPLHRVQNLLNEKLML